MCITLGLRRCNPTGLVVACCAVSARLHVASVPALDPFGGELLRVRHNAAYLRVSNELASVPNRKVAGVKYWMNPPAPMLQSTIMCSLHIALYMVHGWPLFLYKEHG